MAKTLLAVDDSVTMRKVLEITFSGEDFRVISAESTHAALGKMAESPQVAVIDTVLAGEDGYALAKEVRKRHPGTAILLLASRYAPYDQARGKDSGADDWADKPFDTQQLIDKVRKIMVAKEASGGTAVSAPAPPPPAMTPSPPQARPASAVPMPTPSPSPLGRGTQPSLSNQLPNAARTGTLVFGENAPVIPPARPAPPPAAAAPPPPPPAPPLAPAAHAPAPHVAPPPAVAAAVNGHMSAKLGALGLSQEQAAAVLALSREVVERVVWEVVPQLAEALIKEEIARLTKD